MHGDGHDLTADDYGVSAFLIVAKWLRDRGRARDAERFLKEALNQADEIYGESSPESGMVLLDLHELYQDQRREDEAEPVWERVRKILISGVSKFKNG